MRNFSIWQRQREIKGNLSLLPTTTYAPHQYGTTCQHVSVMPRGMYQGRISLAARWRRRRHPWRRRQQYMYYVARIQLWSSPYEHHFLNLGARAPKTLIVFQPATLQLISRRPVSRKFSSYSVTQKVLLYILGKLIFRQPHHRQGHQLKILNTY